MKLLAALTPHGFGHVTMTAPVLNAFWQIRPDVEIGVMTAQPRAWLETRLAAPFDLHPPPIDFGMKMHSALAVDQAASAAAYRTLLDDAERLIRKEKLRLQALAPDLLLVNIPFLTLLAAAELDIPAVGFAPLNWWDLYRALCGDAPEAPAVAALMERAYRSLRLMITPAPSMPMTDLGGLVHPVGPVARQGHADRAGVRARLGMRPEQKLGLIAFGGMEAGLDWGQWPRLPGWRWIVSGDPAGHPDMIGFDAVGWPFVEVLSACDVVIGKPGYGTFSEAGVNGIPLLALPRPDWPEAPYSMAWLQQVGRCASCDLAGVFDGPALHAALTEVLSQPAKPPVSPSGAQDSAAILAALLDSLG